MFNFGQNQNLESYNGKFKIMNEKTFARIDFIYNKYINYLYIIHIYKR